MQQQEALDILKLGHNVYLTGAAGSGKTYVLNDFIRHLRENGIAVGVTASTGIAATHMNGMTIHSWAGIGIHDELDKHEMEKLLSKARLKKRFKETKVLIIDEVSMLHGKRLDMIDAVCRAFKNASKPFGGLQVILSGDLFQLPPVTRHGPVDFVFQSKAWSNMNLKVCYLGEQYRQEDQRLLDILSAIRSNEVDERHFEHLEQRFTNPPVGKSVTRLYTHNSAVDKINNRELANLKTEEKSYVMSGSGNKKLLDAITASCMAPEILKLKIGAEVMFVANNFADGYVNGTLGRVSSFNKEGFPVIETADKTLTVKPRSWMMQEGERVLAEISQLPLRLAWAITVHKSQGMSLDAAEVDLSRSFEPGMGYVALSRVRELEGLFIKGINNTALVVNPAITKLDESLRIRSDKAQAELAKISSADMKKHHKRVEVALQSDETKLLANYDEKLLKRLRNWRTKQARAQSAPAYVVLSDKTLKLISAIKPSSLTKLSEIHGIGAKKLEQYGEQILKLVQK